MLTKRDFLKLAPAAGVVSAASLVPLYARADGQGAQVLAAQRFMVGEVRVTALSDGYLHVDHEGIPALDADAFREMLALSHQTPESYRGSVNAYLLETPSSTWMVDAGSGVTMGEHLGDVPRVLTELGVDRASVSKLFFTHMHLDHIGGALTNGQAAFPHAEIFANQADVDFWTSNEIKATLPEIFHSSFVLAQNVMGAYADRAETFNGESSITSGVTAVPLPGHTVGHTGFLLESGSDSILFLGDMIHVPEVQLRRPDIFTFADTDPDTGVSTRVGMLEELARTGRKVAGMHLPFPGIGYIEKIGDHFAFQPARWEYL